MKKEEAFEQTLRQVLQKRNEQSPVLPQGFARRVKARMDSRRRRTSIVRWAAVGGIAASLFIGTIWIVGWGEAHPTAHISPERQRMEQFYRQAEQQALLNEQILMERVRLEHEHVMQSVREAQSEAEARIYTAID